ncbi:U2 small nuclear ribonucleoprotein A like LRR repeats [Cryptosporidium sp. chipmunk genotype I]|uniref:U2 small nuclear ribonucleoprotein A like LRR repeats n=1 Tax=Cryptosporidium sp. chipmunk genotype I TaxID=1280935 RepID=UPI003519F3C3|nr:U2 small nuclear ribonucleoprotein A like LRR repeats [Cryptosporidium sp. chipmunk genotype I]
MDTLLTQLSTIFLNKINESYSFNIRNSKIRTFDNTGILKDQFECIDLSDNSISSLTHISNLNRLSTFIACNNQIEFIECGFTKSLPNLESLVLTNNKLSNIESISAIFFLRNLKRLSLINNPITKVPNYKTILIGMLPNLIYLDFQKISKVDRSASELFFETNSIGKELLVQYSVKNFENSSVKMINNFFPSRINTTLYSPENKPSHIQFNNIKIAISLCNDIKKLRILEDSLMKNEITPEAQKIVDECINK